MRDSKQFHDTHMSLHLKHDKAAEVATSNAKRYPEQSKEYLAKAKDHSELSEKHRKEAEHWAKEHKAGR